MRILGFDTALGACSAALWADGAVRARRFATLSRGHAEILLPMIQDVCAEAGCGFDALDRLAVTIGPGSFAGTRVGLAAARGLALATGLPLVGVTTLEAVVAGLAADAETALVAVLDAYRGEVYVQLFGPGLEPRSAPAALPPDAAAALVDRPRARLAGSGAAVLSPLLAARGVAVDVAAGREQPDAAWVAALAAGRAPGVPPAPLYLRPPDATPPARRLVGA